MRSSAPQTRPGTPASSLLDIRRLWWLAAALLLFTPDVRAQEEGVLPIRTVLIDRDNDYVPDRLGQTVEVVGVLTTDPNRVSETAILANLQDRRGGILLFTREVSLLEGRFARGDSVWVRGVVGQHRGAEEVQVERIERLGAGTLPEPRDALVSELLGSRYSGRLVRVAGELILSDGDSDRFTATLRDRSGEVPVYISKSFLTDPKFVEKLQRGGQIEIVGIATQHKAKPPFDSGYQLLPRDPEDFSFVPVPPYREVALLVGILSLVGVSVSFSRRRRQAERRAREMEQLTSELQRAKDDLEREKAYLRTVIDTSPNGVVVKDRQGRFTLCNRAMADFYGVAPEDVIGRTDTDLGVPAEAAVDFLRTDVEVVEKGQGIMVDAVPFTSPGTGETRWFETRKVPLDVPGDERQVLGLVIDVTDRLHAEERIRTQSMAMDASMEGMAVLDRSGHYIYANRAHGEVYGYDDPRDLIGKSWRDLYSDAEVDRMEEGVMPVLFQNGNWRGESIGTRRDGSTFPQELSLTALDDGGIICVVRDAAERLQLEEQLRQSQKMEAVGRLAGGIAHDFNNLLQVIQGNASFALESIPEDHPAREDLLEIGRASERAGDMVRQLLAFSRNQVVRPTVLDLNIVVSNTDRMLRRLLGRDIELVTLLDPGLGSVQADSGQLEQILVNLAVNARDAMPEGGKLSIVTQNVVVDPNREPDPRDVAPGRYVVLTVSDTGTGMDGRTVQRIFEPFFTTKEQGKGTGLGLSIIYGIVQQHGGVVEVESVEGKGTAFRIYLPRAEAVVQAPAETTRVASRTDAGSGVVFVVDDEKMVRRLASRVLARSGFTVVEASNGEEALRLAAAHEGPIDLLLTDMVMPLMGGRQLAERVSALRPDTRILFMSGYDARSTDADAAPDTEAPLLPKPFDPATLVQTVHEILAGQPVRR